MISQPKVSFCIPVHNAASFIRETIKSILQQQYINIEIICVDDHSADDSFAILESYGKKIHLSRAKEKGAAAARNQAFQDSSGELVIFFDADDLIDPRFVATQIASMQHPRDVVVSKWGRFYDSQISFVEDQHIEARALTFREWIEVYWTHVRHMTPPGRVLIPRILIEEGIKWNPQLTLNDDFPFFTKIFEAANFIRYNPTGTFFYRSGIGGLSSKTKEFVYQNSNFTAIHEGTSIALNAYPDILSVRVACANMWQQFIYDNYPKHKELVANAETIVKQLGGSSLPYSNGGLTKIISNLIGWRATKWLKAITNE